MIKIHIDNINDIDNIDIHNCNFGIEFENKKGFIVHEQSINGKYLIYMIDELLSNKIPVFDNHNFYHIKDFIRFLLDKNIDCYMFRKLELLNWLAH